MCSIPKLVFIFIFNYLYYNEYYEIKYTAYEILSHRTTANYPIQMLSLTNYLIKNNLTKKISPSLDCSDSEHYVDVVKYDDYKLEVCDNTLIKDDIYLNVSINEKSSKDEKNPNLSAKLIEMVLRSKNHNINELKNFVDECVKEYKIQLKQKSKNKMYHFIYNGITDGKNSIERLQFSQSTISDFDDINNINYETFDHIEHIHKQQIIKDLDLLNNIEYYKKHGLKRKLGYLFYGNPGCGKTSTVMAIANYQKRHIMEIPLSRVKTNSELEKILNLTSINNISFKKNEIIILFDEIDACDVVNIRDGESEKEKSDDSSSDMRDMLSELIEKKEKESETKSYSRFDKDKLSIGTILSRLDGIGSYNGLIIIGTTNIIDNISPALYRDGRLNKMFFDYAQKEYIAKMIEKSYDIKLEKEEIDNLPDIKDKISYSTIKKTIMQYYDDYKNLLVYLKSLKK